MRKLTGILFLVLFLVPLASSVSVGVSPGFVNLGDVDPGDTREMDFYITTNMDEEFEVAPEYRQTTKFIGINTGIELGNTSEENIRDWIDWSQDEYNINPDTPQTYQLPDGTQVSAAGSITMEIDIPSNPEPGYRVGEIDLNPSISGDGGGTGARVFGQTVPGFAFRLPGSVERDIDTVAIEGVRIGENKVQMIFQLRNTGTVTTTFTGGDIDIKDISGNNVGTLSIPEATLKPGEAAEVDEIWYPNSIEGGEYSVEGTGDYSTGETYISGEFVLTDTLQQRQQVDEPSGAEVEPQEDEAPLVLIVILSVLISVLLYLADVSATWIIMLTGGIAVTLFIVLGSASNVLVLIPLLSLGFMMYV